LRANALRGTPRAMTEILSSLDPLFNDYDAIYCDVWGVVHNGRTPFKPACEALSRARAAGKPVILVSNVPKPREPIPGQLDRIGVPRESWDAIVTSGDAIRAELALRAPGPMYKIGPDHDRVLWAGLGVKQSELNEAAFIAISGLNDDANETPEDYADILHVAKARDLELLCANPDIVVRVGDALVWCAGAIARDYKKLGGRVVMAGKPYPPIYAEAARTLAGVAGKEIPNKRILAIGDGIGTDLLGANRAKIDALFIASGMHGEKFVSGGDVDLDNVMTALAEERAKARYVMAGLA
jgi:HAD superfamily hydrolase (TIGR01459 family)